MKVSKSKIFRDPGLIRWEATPPSGEGVDLFIMHSKDGISWIDSGPYRVPSGERIALGAPGKIKLRVQLQGKGFVQAALKKVWIHRFDDIFEYGEDCGW